MNRRKNPGIQQFKVTSFSQVFKDIAVILAVITTGAFFAWVYFIALFN